MKNKRTLITLGGILFIAGVLSLFASSSPDGLEKTAESLGFSSNSQSWWSGLIPDYTISALGSSPLATSLAGIIGTLMVYALFSGAARLIARQVEPKTPAQES